MSDSQQEPEQYPPHKRQHHPSVASMKPPLVAPGEYHRFEPAESRGGPDQVSEAIVIKSSVSILSVSAVNFEAVVTIQAFRF